MPAPDERILWQLPTAVGTTHCVMMTCCAGAELQVLVNDEIVLRELYPDKSDLYERARQLKTQYSAAQGSP